MNIYYIPYLFTNLSLPSALELTQTEDLSQIVNSDGCEETSTLQIYFFPEVIWT